MNSTEQAKNGFKTFVITLSISLILFSIVYYVLTDATGKINIESEDQAQFKVTEDKVSVTKSSATTQTASVFGDLKDQKSVTSTSQKVVLGTADTTETSQSTVPSTGILSTTYALIMSLSATLLAFYFLIQSRRKALLNFEKEIRKN